MDKDRQDKVDQALDALAREVNGASPRPGSDLVGRVMEDAAATAAIGSEAQLDAALATLVDEVAAASPRPGPDLVARVLADAARVAGDRPAPEPVRAPQTQSHAQTAFRLFGFGWASGAAVAMVAALVIGIGVGMQVDPSELGLMTEAPGADLSMADGGFILEDIL
ncbi:MAG: hypothetical protein AAGB15_09825 [Pseudomonadota bacterium]